MYPPLAVRLLDFGHSRPPWFFIPGDFQALPVLDRSGNSMSRPWTVINNDEFYVWVILRQNDSIARFNVESDCVLER